MYIKKLFLFAAFCSFLDIKAQTFTIKYKYLQIDNFTDSLYFDILKSFRKEKKTNEIEVYPIRKKNFEKKDTLINTINYRVTDTAIAFIFDGFGHQSFIIPNDTVTINVQKRQIQTITNRFPVTWFHDFTYNGRNRYIYSLFDSLTILSGSVFMDFTNINSFKFNLSIFFDSVTAKYKKRLLYIDDYCFKYKIPSNIKSLALSEVKSAYINNLLGPFLYSKSYINLKDLPQDYINTLTDVSFGNAYYFFRTSLYASTALSYYNLFTTKYLKNIEDKEELFKQTYSFVKKEENLQMRDYFLGNHLINNVKNNFASFDTFYVDYKKQFLKSHHIKEIDSLIIVYKNATKPDLKAALNSVIHDSINFQLGLKEIIKVGRPVIIDCWASWCKPCIIQMPFSFQFEKEYGDRISFIYLSFDKDKKAWLEKQRNIDISNNSYIISKDFKSDFASYFGLTFIPRYIAIDKHGKVFNDNLSQPSKKDEFRKVLDTLLEK